MVTNSGLGQSNVDCESLSFFKIFQGADLSSESMRAFPYDLIRNIPENDFSRNMVITTQWGRSWEVEISMNPRFYYMEKRGWNQFVRDNALGQNELVTFTHEGLMCFSVNIYQDSEINSGNLENLYDDWEFKENEIIHARNKLRSTREKLAVLEGKLAMAITDAQRIVREKQRKIDHASRALRLLRTASIVWPNLASEVLLTGSFDGWSTQIKFIVDGQWKVDPLRPIVTCGGYENNLLIIS